MIERVSPIRADERYTRRRIRQLQDGDEERCLVLAIAVTAFEDLGGVRRPSAAHAGLDPDIANFILDKSHRPEDECLPRLRRLQFPAYPGAEWIGCRRFWGK